MPMGISGVFREEKKFERREKRKDKEFTVYRAGIWMELIRKISWSWSIPIKPLQAKPRADYFSRVAHLLTEMRLHQWAVMDQVR
jgi:hypothetical protein